MTLQDRTLRDGPEHRRSVWQRLTPPQLFVGSFLLLICIGTLGLMFLPGLYTGEPLSWVDALFTATSAVCVTGLIVVDTATHFTTAGQAWILLLFQLGGLGIITFTTVIILAFGRRLSLRHEVLATDLTTVAPHVDFQHLFRNIFVFTFGLELIGAIVLYFNWTPQHGAVGAVWPSIFHAVSAFCNAGFSVFSDSLMSYQNSPGVQLTVMGLIVLGGIGFLTLEELYLLRKGGLESRRFRLSLHSRIVLLSTTVLILAGAVLITIFEWNVTMAELAVPSKLLNGSFASITARTAGFNTIDYAQATESTNFLTIILMFIGGSPGSTAGGIKTTTFVIIGIVAWSRFRGRQVASFWGRSLPEETTQRAIGLFVVAFGLVTLSIFVLTATEFGRISHAEAGGSFLEYMFEASSAFNTVGLSMGVTSDLSVPGRLVTIALMFLGRVGPLTLAAALARKWNKPIGGLRYAYEDVVVG